MEAKGAIGLLAVNFQQRAKDLRGLFSLLANIYLSLFIFLSYLPVVWWFGAGGKCNFFFLSPYCFFPFPFLYFLRLWPLLVFAFPVKPLMAFWRKHDTKACMRWAIFPEGKRFGGFRVNWFFIMSACWISDLMSWDGIWDDNTFDIPIVNRMVGVRWRMILILIQWISWA